MLSALLNVETTQIVDFCAVGEPCEPCEPCSIIVVQCYILKYSSQFLMLGLKSLPKASPHKN